MIKLNQYNNILPVETTWKKSIEIICIRIIDELWLHLNGRVPMGKNNV